MPKCPWCGSTAQVKVVETNYIEDGWEMEVQRHCVCGCGVAFVATSWYTSDAYERVEIETRKKKAKGG